MRLGVASKPDTKKHAQNMISILSSIVNKFVERERERERELLMSTRIFTFIMYKKLI